jgi:transposase
MEQYVGLDVAQAETAVCVIDAHGKRQWQGSCRSTPQAITSVLKRKAPHSHKVAMETGPLAVWLWHSLRSAGVPVVCLHARHAKAALSVQMNKTDANDAFGLAQIVRAGWYREVEVKSIESHKLRLLLAARAKMVSMRTMLYGQIRGLLKTFGVVLPAGKGSSFERLVLRGVPADGTVTMVVKSLLATWNQLMTEVRKLDRLIIKVAAVSPICRRLMTVPGVGPTTAVAYLATIDQPKRFARSRNVGPYLGLTPRRYQSGEVDYAGRISKCGDRILRSLLFEAAGVLLFRNKRTSPLKEWGLRLARRVGSAKARVAVARKLAVVLHRLWVDETEYRYSVAS